MRRKWITLLRVVRYGVNNFSRNAWLSMAATLVMVITLSIILSTFAMRMVFTDTIEQIREKIDVSVYLKDNVTEEQRADFTKALESVPIVTSVEYITKDQAQQIFIQKNRDYYDRLQALGELDENPLPASLRIRTSDPNRLNEVAQVIERPEFKDLQSEAAATGGERKAAIDNITKVSEFAEVVALGTSIFFVAISIMIIFNTIRMAIFNRRDEIDMMKLIGADKSFIRGPFIVEAAFYGVLAAVVSFALIFFVFLAVGPALRSYEIELGPTIKFFTDWPFVILIVQILIGIAIGVLSSLMAMRRYLKI